MTYFDGKEASTESVSEESRVVIENSEIDNEKLSFLLNDLEKKLIRMEEVLTQIDTAGYGKCEECGNDIEGEILKDDPLALKCSLHRKRD